MTEPFRNRLNRGDARAVVKGNEMSNSTSPAIVVPNAAIEALTKRPLTETNSVANASVDFYLAALAQVGIDPASLSFAEIVEVTRRLYAPSADYRRSQADVVKAEREAAEAIRRAEREAAAAAKLEADIKKAEAKLKALQGK